MQNNIKSNIDDFKVADSYADLFKSFEENNISWCSWKSNEHLGEALDGSTDIDVLFDENQKDIVIKIMRDCGFVLFEPPSYRRYPGIIDAISVDVGNGKILHVHSHFMLTFGEKHLKSMILPWNKHVLQRRISSEYDSNIYISSYSDEAVLLLVREAAKIRWRDLFSKLKRNKIGKGKGFIKEINWLKKRTNPEDIRNCSLKLLNEDASNIINEIILNGTDEKSLLKLNHAIKNISVDEEWQRMSKFLALFRVWWREGIDILIRILDKLCLFQNMIIRRRTFVGGGVIIAFLGADGSGKSTITKKVVSDWSNKIDVSHIYFGTGDGQNAISQKLLKFVFSWASFVKKKLKRKSSLKKSYSDSVSISEACPSFSTILQAIVSVNIKKKQIRYVEKLKSRGFMLICDRWPQNQIYGINDGPLLSSLKNSKNPIYKFLANWEYNNFKKICSALQPDLVVKLNPSLEVAVNRKEENKNIKELIAKKIEAVNILEFKQETECYTINADQPLDNVLMDVRGIIWKFLQKKSINNKGVYECLGLPGAGKTTICHEIYKGNNVKSIIDVFNPSKRIGNFNKLKLFIKSIFVEPLIYVYAISISIRYKLWKSLDALSYIFRIPVQKLRMQSASRKDKYLLEQFLLQNIWSAFVSGNVKNVKPKYLAPFIEAVYNKLDTNILFFDISSEEASKRVSKRINGTSRFDGLDYDEILLKINGYSELMNNIKKASLYAGLNIVEIDANLPINDIISDKISPLIGKDR